MATKIGSLLISLGLDSGEFKSGLSQAEKNFARTTRSFEKLGDKISGLGTKMSIGITAPFVAFGVAATKAALESRDALGQVETALKSMGGAAGRTADQLSTLASKQMLSSLYDDDEILRKVTANLLTFGKVSGKTFDQAQQAAIDLSARLGTDLQSSAIMLGKALNDPAKGITALTRVGVAFTEQQKKQIKTMTAAGDVAGAQGLILAELNKQYGGSAQAALDAAGPMAKLKKQFDEISETVGAAIIPALERITPYIQRAADAFLRLSPEMQTAVVAGAALAAALGPVLIAVGGLVKFAAPMLAFIKITSELAAAQTTLAAGAGVWAAGLGSILASLAPIAIAAGAAYVAWKNWDDIAPRLTPIIGNLRDIAEFLGLIGPKTKEAGDKSKDATSDMEDLGEAAANASNKFQLWADAFDEYNARTAKAARDNGTTIQAGLHDLWDAFENFHARANALPGQISAAMGRLYYGVKNWLGDKLGNILSGVRDKIAAVGDWFHDLYIRVVGNSDVPDMVEGIADWMAKLDTAMVEPAKKATKNTGAAFRQMASEVQSVLDRLFPQIAAARKYAEETSLLGNIKDPAARSNALRALGREQAGLPTESRSKFELSFDPAEAAKPLDSMSEATERLMKRLADLKDKTKETTVRVAKSFKDMATETMSALSNLSNAIKGGGFLNILEAVIGLGIQLGSIGAFGKKIQANINSSVPGYASGGYPSRGLALVGERGPELVSFRGGERVFSNADSRGMMGSRVQIVPSPYFDVVVDGRVQRAAPGIAGAGAQLAGQQQMFQRSRRLA